MTPPELDRKSALFLDLDGTLLEIAASAAGEHGVSLRFADGTFEELPVGIAVPDGWRDALSKAVERWPGVRIETKPHGLAVHYRLAPEREAEVWELVRALVPSEHPWFRLLPAREAVELGLRAASKGDAVERLMAHAPFHGRRPIFVGDDFTDEAGMSMARRFGGMGLRVAEVFGGDPANVRAWLTHGTERLDPPPPSPPGPSS